MDLKRCLLIFILTLFCLPLWAQDTKNAKDSTQVYKKIETYSEKSKFTKTLHRLIFRPTRGRHRSSAPRLKKKNFSRFEGKIIRNIIIETLDPFGFSVSDTTRTAESWLEKTGNKIHIKSKELAIRNYLLIKENRALDTLLMAESARLLRAQNFIREVDISPHFVSEAKDSIDIVIRELDSWSLIPKASLSGSTTKLSLKERNFLGLGHEFRLGYGKQYNDGDDSFEATYIVPNFKNTYISATGGYVMDFEEHYQKFISIDRTFYSPYTRWAGGLFVGDQFLERTLPNDTLAFVDQSFKFLTQDYWAGHSIRLFSGDSERERSTNLIGSGRVLLVNYKQTPAFEYDRIDFFSDERFYLATIGISSRQYKEDNYIFRDGPTEDVPVGTLYSITGGMQNKNHKNRMYLGGKASYGNYFKLGFLSLDFEIGSFFDGSVSEQTAFSFQANYFSRLLQLNDRWKMRQFFKPQFIIGINRLDSYADRLSLNENPPFNGSYGRLYREPNRGKIQGFDSETVGIQKYILSLQTQFYAPWEVLGFRFNPYVNITAGMLNNGEGGFFTNRLYSAFGVGCIIRNDYLIVNAFQFSFTYYPQMPGQGNNIFKTNAFETEDFGFQDFEIGKPRTISYR